MREIEVGNVSDLPPGAVRVVDAGDREVAVFSTPDGYYALDNACAHQGGPLGEGWVEGMVVTCPWHWWRYHLATGLRQGSDAVRVAAHPVSVREGMVMVEVPDPTPPPSSIREVLLLHAREWTARR